MRTIVRGRTLFSATVAAAVAASAAVASAQETQDGTQSAFALDRFQPAFAGDRMFGVSSPFVAGHLTPHAMLVADYAHNPLVLRRDGEKIGAVVGGQLFLHLNASLALWNRLGINLDVPLAVYQGGDNPAIGTDNFTSPQSAQIGDVRLGLRLSVLGKYWDPVQVAVGGYVWLPTGSSDAGSYVSDGSVRALPQLIAGGLVKDRIVWSTTLGVEIRGAKTIANVQQGSSFQFGLGAGYLLGEQKHVQIGLESSIGTVLDDPNSRNTNAELLASARFRFLNDFEAGLAAGPGLTSGQGTPSFRGVLTFAYTPEQKKSDKDHDGIPDAEDACPDVFGVSDPDPNKNGCPLDKDNDGIPDAKDACVDVPGVKNADPKKNGCPSDKDNDGIPDAKDACPDVPGVADPDPKKNGCPPDKDNDGIPDAKDACVDVPGVADPDPKKNGCPPDKDNDGIPDAKDACPDAPGKAHADPKLNGCPDTDEDKILDPEDACKDVKGVRDPDPTKNGCPPKNVIIKPTEIVITEQIQFDLNKATIKPVSNAILDSVARVLKDYPELALVEVQGHTDSTGSAKLNEKLSQARADSVKDALVKRGIDASRLTTKGYGPSVPIAENKTAAGREKNRRVQFVVLNNTVKAEKK
ncbi:OmpA family protein [Polyangium mundeleinium]|uniref:OmpA family protein n=1 Tax=Polyangium mundeleinium TaxID=2995306 RepID=A0ABT5F3G1_9BACT|nr:OmpA family protein [Polyangium mundeleinium]MDC0748639.1 OmpA family protein [Polyangium mundeleinium]